MESRGGRRSDGGSNSSELLSLRALVFAKDSCSLYALLDCQTELGGTFPSCAVMGSSVCPRNRNPRLSFVSFRCRRPAPVALSWSCCLFVRDCPSRHESHIISSCPIQSRLQRVGLRRMTSVFSMFTWDEPLRCH